MGERKKKKKKGLSNRWHKVTADSCKVWRVLHLTITLQSPMATIHATIHTMRIDPPSIYLIIYTVEPRFTTLIRSWRPFVNRNVRKPKLSKLTSNWHSRADTLTLPLLPACVFVIRDTVRHPRCILLGKFVREPNCSWTGAFVNRGSTVYCLSDLLSIKLSYIYHKSILSTYLSPAINLSCISTSSQSTYLIYHQPIYLSYH
jgi:hypothetical protein